MNRIYLDYAAGSPLLPIVQTKLQEYLASPLVGNPSSLHHEGRAKQAILDKVHTQIAGIIGVKPTEVVLTSGATESNNLAILGALAAWKKQNPDQQPHLVMSSIEHPSWYRVAEKSGAEVTMVDVTKEGIVTVEAVLAALNERTVLVGCAYVNNEIGTVQPVGEIGKAIEGWRLEKKASWPLFHTDAVQAFPHLNTHIGHLHADTVTFSGHKYGALEGVGCLIVKTGSALNALFRGGGQEWGLRAGTENVLGALSLGEAMQWQSDNREEVTEHVQKLQQMLESQINHVVPSVKVLSSESVRAPHITYLWFPHVTDEHVMHQFDLLDFAVSSGSACSSGATLPSSTLMALGYSAQEAFGGIRVSYGWKTTQQEIESFVLALKELVT